MLLFIIYTLYICAFFYRILILKNIKKLIIMYQDIKMCEKRKTLIEKLLILRFQITNIYRYQNNKSLIFQLRKLKFK